MCPPVLAIAATAMSAIGTGIGALQAASTARFNAKLADRNADMEEEAAHEETKNTTQAARLQYRKIADAQGAAIAAQAANGVDVNFGSARQAQQDIDMLGAEDVANIYRQGYQRVRGFDINAANSRAQAAASRADAKGALIGGVFDVGSSILSGASQYSKLKGMGGGKNTASKGFG